VIATAGWYVCGDEQVHALLAHRKLATMFVERGGLALLLGLPRNTWTHAGVARCLYALSAVAVVIETCFIADAETPRQVRRHAGLGPRRGSGFFCLFPISRKTVRDVVRGGNAACERRVGGSS
jgi:hypothetical protein